MSEKAGKESQYSLAPPFVYQGGGWGCDTYHAYLDLLVDRFDELRYIHLARAENQFVDALATLASII